MTPIKFASEAVPLTAHQKDRLFCKANFLFSFYKTTKLIVEWGSYLASLRLSLTRELHGSANKLL